MDNKQQLDKDLIIDWNLSLKLAGNKKDLATDLLSLLIKMLPREITEIKKAKSDNDVEDLLSRLHKLHGAICYVGLPRLKKAMATLESSIKKNNQADIATQFTEFEHEVTQVLEQAPKILE